MPVPEYQLDIFRRMKCDFLLEDEFSAVEPPDLILDGIIGYSLRSNPRGAAGDVI